MIPRRIGLIAALAATSAAACWMSQGRPAEAATVEGAAPGQLAMVDQKGDAIGLCPLKHTDVSADIAGYVARVTVKQEFVNPSKTPVEAMYTFPLPNDAAIDDMTMTIGSRVVRGQIKRKEEALAIYDAAKASGQSAALLDQERPNVFTQQVANIMPGAKVEITIRYVNLLKYQEGQYEFVFPMVVGHRYSGSGYISSAARGAPSGTAKLDFDPGATPVVLDAHRITPPITPPGTRAGHDISLTVHLDAGVPLQAVAAVGHRVSAVRVGQTSAIVTLANQQEIPNRDFILHYTAAGSEMAEGLLAYAPPRASGAGPNGINSQGGYFTMIIQPPLAPPKEEITPKEMVFVIDQTGSQSGWPIAKAKETMRYCIANMNPGDTFQLIGFNTALYPCFPAPVPNTPDNVAKALKFLEPIEGNGGTDILKSVDYALGLPDDPDRLRIVCYMTDGYVGNDMQIIDYIRKHRGRARMFPFGIGNSVNRFLIDGMAREGRGASEYVAVNTNQGAQFGTPGPARDVKGAQEAAQRFYRRIASPLLLDVHVDWNGLPVEDVYPKQIPDVFTAGPIILKGRYSRAAEGDITVHGLLRGQPWSRTVHVTLPAVRPDGSALATLWAREKIEDLQSQDWLGAQTNSPHPEIQTQIVNTALEYHLMSQYTSFVAVEQRIVNIGGRQRMLDVPVETPDGVAYDSILDRPETPSRKQTAELLVNRAGFGGSSMGRNARSRGGANPLHEFGVNGQVLAKPSDNSILRSSAYGPAPGGGSGSHAAKEQRNVAEGLPAGAPKAPAPMSRLAGQPAAVPASGSALATANARKDSGSVRAGKPASPSASTSLGYMLSDNIADGEKQLAELKPDERRALIERVKLAPALKARLDAFRKARSVKPEVIEVEVWVAGTSTATLAKLKALGFRLEATITPHRLLLGTVSMDKLDGLLNLPFVRHIEPPRFK